MNKYGVENFIVEKRNIRKDLQNLRLIMRDIILRYKN